MIAATDDEEEEDSDETGSPAVSTDAGLEPIANTDSSGAKIPVIRPGVVVGPKGVKASDFSDVVRALILRACGEFEAMLCTKNAIAGLSERIEWAKEAWKKANKVAKENYVLTDEIRKLVRSNMFMCSELILFL